MKIMVTTYPFGEPNNTPVRQLEGYDVHYNDVKRKYSQPELVERLKKFQPDVIIAGTEKYTPEILDLIPKVKIISRVGIGLDNVPVEECKKRGIIVAYTPDAPTNAVSELVICQMLNCLRQVQEVDGTIRKGGWNRFIGKDIRDCDIGIFGCGRVGKLVIEKLQGLKPRRIFVNDIVPERMRNLPRCEAESKMQILASCDIITVHIPYDAPNFHFINDRDLKLMRPDAILINTSRGEIVNEQALVRWLKLNPNARAAVDVYEQEPYTGDLVGLPNAYLTPHLGSCSRKSRLNMELGAVEEVLNYFESKPLNNRVA